MRRRKLKSFVLPTVYIMTITVVFISIVFLGNIFTTIPYDNEEERDYVVDSVIDTEVPVVSEPTKFAVKPYNVDTVQLSKDYYSMTDEEKIQENSLIYYQSTYMQNTGVLYTATEIFDVISVLDGTIKNVTNDEVLGVVVEISHDKGYTSHYYSLSEVTVKVGDEVKIGDVIGKSGDNKVENNEGSSLLFEVYYQGKTVDPNVFYETDLTKVE